MSLLSSLQNKSVIDPEIKQEEEKPVEEKLTPVVSFNDICLSYGDFKLFDHLNFEIPDFSGEGQFISILGQSGSGKSQLLKLLANLNSPDSGEIKIYDTPRKNYYKSIPMTFQQYSCFPFRTVLEEVEWPLKLKQPSFLRKMYNKIRGLDRPYPLDEYIRERALSALKTVGLEGQENKWARYPILSGGQLQRICLAKSLVSESQIILLDEATSALDIFSKREMQNTLLNIYNSAVFDPTIINVTHDISEAVYLSNRIYILQANPCRVYKIIDIKFDQPRNKDLKRTEEFNNYISMVEEAMEEIQTKNG